MEETLLIYIDTSVLLAQLLAEDRQPPASVWQRDLVSSRLLEYEIWTRINARKLGKTHGDAVRTTLGRIALMELAPPVLQRALDPFPLAVRTLDALHLASVEFLIRSRQSVALATYDDRLVDVAKRMRIPVEEL